MQSSTRMTMVALCLVASGCGEDESPRYTLSGYVLYAGLPVPKGQITLTPDAVPGLTSPALQAPIVEGRYALVTEAGFAPGPHSVRITGTDGVATRWQGEDLPEGKTLFSPYQNRIDLPPQDVEFNFDITKAK